MLKTFDIILDLEKQTKNNIFNVSQNDLNSIQINMTILQDGKTVNLTGTIPRIVIKKPRGKKVIQDCDIVDAVNSKISVILDTQSIIEAGKHLAEIYIYQGNSVSVTGTFEYISNKAILDPSTVESTNDFQDINNMLIALNDLATSLNMDVYKKSEVDAKFNTLTIKSPDGNSWTISISNDGSINTID
jgi:hypothetical protein